MNWRTHLIYGLSAAALMAITPQSVQAQAQGCRIPPRISLPAIIGSGKARRMPITGYTLALSWSPEFCRQRGDSRRDAVQCSGQNGRFGFIVHGLWPEGRSGWPQWCPTPRQPSPATIRRNLCMMPSPYLIGHEWAKHGSCMVRTPEAYYKITRILWNSLTLPDMIQLSRDKTLTAGDVRRRFVAMNGWRWEPSYVGVKLNKRGWMKELYLCYGKDFLPARCKPSQFGVRDKTRVKIWRGR